MRVRHAIAAELSADTPALSGPTLTLSWDVAVVSRTRTSTSASPTDSHTPSSVTIRAAPESS
jgi:hypothetical protein